jgi:hypothetical protein
MQVRKQASRHGALAGSYFDHAIVRFRCDGLGNLLKHAGVMQEILSESFLRKMSHRLARTI